MNQQKKSFNVNQWSVIVSITIAIIIIINIIAYSLPLRLDLTSKGLYSLSDTTKKYLGQFDSEFNIHVYISDELPAQKISSWDLKKYVTDLLSDMRGYSNGNLNYVINMIEDSGTLSPADREKSDNLRKEAVQRGIEEVRIDIMDKNQRVFRNVIIGMFINYRDKEDVIQINMHDPYRLEYELLKKMRKMLSEESPRTLLSSLSEPVDIKLYYTQGQEQGAQVIKKAIVDIFNDYVNGKSGTQKQLSNLMTTDSQEEGVDVSSLNTDKTKFHDISIEGKEQISSAQGDGVQVSKTLMLTNTGLTEALVSLGIAFKHGTKTEAIPSININEQNFHKKFKKAVEAKLISLLSKTRKKIGYVSKKAVVTNQQLMKLGQQGMQFHQKLQQLAEPFENPTLNAFSEMSKDYYELKKVEFESDELKANELDALLVISTNAKFSDWELFQIDQFIMKGKPVAFLMNGIGPDFANYIPRRQFGIPNTASKRNHNLYDLAKHYGVTLNTDMVRDAHSFYLQGFRYKLWIEYSNFPQNNPITDDFSLSVIFPWVSTMSIDAAKFEKQNIKYFPFIKCYKEAKLETSSFNISIEDALNQEKVRMENLAEEQRLSSGEIEDASLNFIGLATEGKYTSYFKGKNAPKPKPKEEPDAGGGMMKGMMPNMLPGASEVKEESKVKSADANKTYTVIPECTKETKLVFTSDRDFFTDLGYTLFSRDHFPNNVLLMQNVIDYLLGNDEMNSVRGKSTSIPNLDSQARQDKFLGIIYNESLTKLLGIFGTPLLIFILGLFIWFSHRNRKNTIIKQFKD